MCVHIQLRTGGTTSWAMGESIVRDGSGLANSTLLGDAMVAGSLASWVKRAPSGLWCRLPSASGSDIMASTMDAVIFLDGQLFL